MYLCEQYLLSKTKLSENREVKTTECTQSDNGRFLAYIFIMMEKLVQAGEGGGVHAHPLSIYLPSRT